MLDTVRDFALDRLAESGEEEDVRRAACSLVSGTCHLAQKRRSAPRASSGGCAG